MIKGWDSFCLIQQTVTSTLVSTLISSLTNPFSHAIKTPPYPLLLSFLYTVYPAGKISVEEIDEVSHDSQPAIISGEWSETKLINEAFLATIL